MCGIVAYLGTENAAPLLISALQRLEYRGYDSAGIALVEKNIEIHKSKGDIARLKEVLPDYSPGKCGIAHTRWATHGKPTVENAHPHLSHSKNFVLVHNGIIENYNELKKDLILKGYSFKSDTDSEVLVNQIDFEFEKSQCVFQAVQNAINRMEGSFAFALMSTFEKDKIYSARYKSPLVVGKGQNGYFLGSDAIAIGDNIDELFYLDDANIATISMAKGVEIYNFKGEKQLLKSVNVEPSLIENAELGNFEDYMLKEIFEQAEAVARSLNSNDGITDEASFSSLKSILGHIKRIVILGCGTSWHAGLIGKYLIEKLAQIPVEVEYASEYRYRSPIINKTDLVISISQSGETADTIAANNLAVQKGAKTLTICNVPKSTLTRNTDYSLFLHAGVEIGVASTKGFSSQVSILTQLAFFLAKEKDSYTKVEKLQEEIHKLPHLINKVLLQDSKIEKMAAKFSMANNFLFIGRGINYPVALEGALKLKEISYIHAEGYPGAEMKHGPIALIDWSFPTLAIVTDKQNALKMASNILEIKSRNGKVLAICCQSDIATQEIVDEFIAIPDTADELIPILSVIPCQLFSYYMAKQRGLNVDRPRNLAKSVTVE